MHAGSQEGAVQEPGETETYFRENKGGMNPQLLALALIRSQRFIGKLQPVGNPLFPEQQHPKLEVDKKQGLGNKN